MVFEQAAQTQDIPAGQMKAVKIGTQEVLIANINGAFYAVSNVCTHQGGNLSKGKLEGNVITCPRHKAQFDLTNGKVVSPPKIMFMHPTISDLPTFTAKVEGNKILIELK
ncbi:MAG: non-heme iron oxygenase ferredoxin subunit [Candidatus Bathyarchaeota archaeon]|nr:non-heme iron oxygenase ferredoxin subunit [Candidatus Bathyarchaeota archaeon]